MNNPKSGFEKQIEDTLNKEDFEKRILDGLKESNQNLDIKISSGLSGRMISEAQIRSRLGQQILTNSENRIMTLPIFTSEI